MRKTTSTQQAQPPQREHPELSAHAGALGAVRVAPLHGETTLSYMSRVASRYRLTAKELIGALVDVGRRPNLFTVRPDGEVVFNSEARAMVAAFCRMPEEPLLRALPAWDREVPSSMLGSGPAAWVRTAATIPPTGPGCRACTARATQGREEARRYLLPHARVCVTHQCWMLEAPVVDGATAGPGQLDVRHVQQVSTAQRRHVRLRRRSPHAGEAFAVAQAVTASWWDVAWPEETLWPDRLRLMTHAGGLAWRVAARDAVIYPEAVTLATALADAGVQQQLLDEAGRHQPHSLADVPRFVGELARRLERPWIAGRLAAVTTGPLNAWVRACVRSQAGHRPKTRNMWRISPPHRPTPVSQLLAESSDRGETPAQPELASLPDSAEDAARGFARGLRHARTYAAEHGHLCAPNTVRTEGFAVGLWLANQRAAGPELAPERAAALDALDPWWNPPWNLWWQRIYHRAQAHVRAGQPLAPDLGFPGTPEGLGEWLYDQCADYHQLHPQQQRLLTDIGITPERARAAKPRRKNIKAVRHTALDHARAYAAQHGHLCAPTSASQGGFTVGKWLHSQRVHARRSQLDPVLNRTLTDIDPWWNPSWPTDWQHEHHHAHAAVTAGALPDPEAGFRNFDDRTGQWLYAQCVNYHLLQPGQQELVALLGITEPVAGSAVPNPATRHPAMETGLHFARAWAAAHGTLDLPRTARHSDFPLGSWLARQRHQANLHRDLFGTPWPREEHLARIDPYWNPPWGMKWQRRYQAARTQLAPGQNLAPEEGFPGTPDWTGQWLYNQCAVYDELHPRQRQLLADLGLTAEGARTAQPRRIPQATAFAVGLVHATSWADQQGHLTVTADTLHDGYPLGRWLVHQRKRAARGRLPDDRTQALAALDPWWNPPWPMRWQQALHTARTHTTGRCLATTAGLSALPSVTAKWLFTQCSSYDSLHPEQQQLLAEIGLTSEHAHALAPPPKPSQPPRSVRPRLKNPPSSLNAGLPYARAWAAQHGNLTSAGYRTEHEGFPLGWWLYKQRRAAHDHLKRTGNPWLHDPQLTALDPWWNPPWRVTWNHSWHQAHTHHSAGHPFSNQTIKWIRTQQRAWDQLHPHQQHLLNTIGIHGPTPLCRYNSRPANLTDQPTELINTHKTNPEQESRSSQARPGPARKQRHTPRQHPPHRRTQPAN
ncbi:helicase associated domain-containing protein [Streptomyces pseudogriseolus]|uniref:helicase associated domain-containing protein n=1 Tax=Streptomyces pseudogriseolus TaxID=36817 RepID=UPI00348A2FAF|nr:helicase associated domain-containing protein [Streptomyces pseudogriseolus]